MKSLNFEISTIELKGKSGIYQITCKNHTYIGSSKSLYSRLNEHRADLRDNVHSNDFMRNACNKYGINEFTYTILEFCDPEIRLHREKYYMDLLKPDFNLQIDPLSRTLSDYSKQKLFTSIKKGRKEGKYKYDRVLKPILQFDIKGKQIKEYVSAKEISKLFNIKEKIVADACREYHTGRLIIINNEICRLKYKYDRGAIKTFNGYHNQLLRHFDMFVDGKKVKANIREFYLMISNQIINKKLNFNIELKNKTK